MKAFDVLLRAVREERIFLRNKCPLETKVFACLLYMAGISYRGMTFQTGMINASHVSVHNWVHRLGTLTSQVPKKERECVAVDESKLKANKSMLFVWSAIDVQTKELLAVYASYQRSSLNTVWFMGRVLKACRGKKPTVLVDGGPWYPWALDRMGFEWQHVTWGKRNAIERETVQDGEGADEAILQQRVIKSEGEQADTRNDLPRGLHACGTTT